MPGGSIPWPSALWLSSVTYDPTQHAAYNSAFPNGPPDFDWSRGDWVHVTHRPRLGAPFTFQGAYWHPALTSDQKDGRIWIWVDMTVDPNNWNAHIPIPNDLSLYNRWYTNTDRYDSRDGRRFALYKWTGHYNVHNPPPAGSGGGSHWYDAVNDAWSEQIRRPW